MLNLNVANQGQVLGVFDQLDAEHPPALAAVIERHERIRTTQAAAAAATLGDVASLTVEALANGRNPATDKAILSALNVQALAEFEPRVAAVLVAEMDAAIHDNADLIVEAWRPGFDTLAATLIDCHTALDGLDLDNADAVLRLGGDAASAWSTATATLQSFHRLLVGWQALATIAHQTVDRRAILLWCAAIDLDGNLDIDLRSAKPWAALDHGMPLTLNTPRKVAEDRAAIAATYQDRSERAARDAHAKRHPPIVV